MGNGRCSLALAALCALVACSDFPSGKGRGSQPAVVRQRMGDTEMTVVFNRPSARGRELFGGIVPYGEVWNPGADEATEVRFSDPVRVAGHPLPAGRYSLWAIPDTGTWTVIFSNADGVFHTPYPEGQDALRIRVRPERGGYQESLGFAFPVATADSALLVMRWGETAVPLPIAPR
ncbi:DUF2911 domain-containing protein [soil metagenome]